MATELADPFAGGDPPPARERHHNEGHGRRLTAAFEALESFPVLAESRKRFLALFAGEEPSPAAVVAAVESDVALTIAVLRPANQLPGALRGEIESVPEAVDALSTQSVRAIVNRLQTFDFFERTAVWQEIPDRFRLHAGSTRHACDRLVHELGYEARDRLAAASLLHDVGKLVLVHAYPGYAPRFQADTMTPEERVERERRELGVDHALVGGVLARRWGLPYSLARAIERHHEPDGGSDAGLVRLADMIAHYATGGTVAKAELLAVAQAAGLTNNQLREVMYDISLPGSGAVPRPAGECPLSARELEVLRLLAGGKVYKQIATELGLSSSTVRSHLHNIYGKVGARDRAQAVLIATERGWL